MSDTRERKMANWTDDEGNECEDVELPLWLYVLCAMIVGGLWAVFS